ncbi:hypothetical protein RN001_010436 [Aquatica leii]|uniref:Ig-like domain-containing protein n=1 Tax=Aquatica leii TaxID=1421715 RepID=A0AAN7P0Y2_9COLE|nr:hypothetical protein RN001_010436 [Aquatica leii]
MQENALKMHAGFCLLFLIPYVKGELRLIISEFDYSDVAKPINSTIELTVGNNYYLLCMIGGYGEFTEPDLKWGRKTKDLKFKTEKDLKQLAKNRSDLFNDMQNMNYYYYQYESNKLVRPFEPVKIADRGTHFCMSLKYELFKIIHIKVKEASYLDTVKSVVTCNANKFRCITSGYCINLHYKCDGKYDCQDGSDEDRIMCGGNPCWNKIQCNDRCIPRSWCCDKHTDENCNVTIRPSCCPPLQNPYDPLLWYNKNVSASDVGKSSGSKYLFITICVVSALLSFVLFLFVISKVCGFDTKPRNPTLCSNNCDHSECVLRRQFSTDVTCLYRRDLNVINNSENNNELADPLILINGHISDQPPSYSEVINAEVTITKSNLDLINAPPPPYSSTNFTMETEHRNGIESNRRCDINDSS